MTVPMYLQANRWKKKGLSVIPLKFGIGWATATYNVFLTLYHGDGTVAIAHGGVESGQGIDTKVGTSLLNVLECGNQTN